MKAVCIGVVRKMLFAEDEKAKHVKANGRKVGQGKIVIVRLR